MKQPTASQHKQQQTCCIMTLYCGLDFLPELCMIKEVNFKIGSSIHSESAVAWFYLERPLSNHKETGRQGGSTKHVYQRYEHYQSTRNLVGRTVLMKSFIPTIAPSMRQLDFLLISCCLVGRLDFRWI